MKKYLFFDLDGTLLAGGYGKTYIPESTFTAIKKLKEQGHFLCIATGRSHAMAKDYMDELGFSHMVSDGGYGITIDKKLIGITPLPKEDVLLLINECKQKNIPWALQIDNTNARTAPDERFQNFTNDTYMKTNVIKNFNPATAEKIYKAYIACNAPVEDSLVSLKKLPWGRFNPSYFFVEPFDKALGIKEMLKHFSAPSSDVIVFGDSSNDLSMFLSEWTKVAMGNAIPELKAKADYVTSNVEEDGIYNACVALGLF